MTGTGHVRARRSSMGPGPGRT